MKFLIQGFGVGEISFVECENTVAVHVIDVHPDSIARDISATEIVCDFPYFLLATVGETTLMVAQSPTGRHRDGPGQFGKAFEDIFGWFPVDDVNAE